MASKPKPKLKPPGRPDQGDEDAHGVLRRPKTDLENAAEAMMRRRDGPGALDHDLAALQEVLRVAGSGSLVRGWRLHMDPEAELQVGFQDFVDACAALHYYGDVLSIFNLTPNPLVLSFHVIAPEEGKVLEFFQLWLKDNFGTPSSLFAHAMRNSGGGRGLCREVFRSTCLNAGYPSADALDLVYDCADVHDEDCLFFEDLIFLEHDPDLRAQEHYKVKLGKLTEWKQAAAQEYWDFVQDRERAKKEGAGFHRAHRRAPRPWLEKYFDDLPAVKSQTKVFRVHEQCKRARLARLGFQEHLRRTFGGDVRGWRRALAPSGFEISQSALRSYVGAHGLKLSPKDVFDGLDQDHDGVVHFDDYNVHTAMSLAKFQLWARSNFGSCEAIWRQPEAAAVSRRLTGIWFPEKGMHFATFKAVLKKLGWPGIHDPEAKRLVLQSLDLQGFGTIDKSDLVWLDGWRPLEWVTAEPNPLEWERLKVELKSHYGHLLRAWRLLLDRDDSNSLSWAEFRDACRRIKFDGDVGSCWRVLDTGLTGAVSMKDYDRESFNILCSFKEWADMHFGSIAECFKSLDEDHSGAVTLKEMRHVCSKLRWRGDVVLLFDCIHVSRQREGGVRSVTMSDLSFLDTWQVEPTEEELAALDLPVIDRPVTPVLTKAVADINERLACPINILKLGFKDWRTASSTPTRPEALSPGIGGPRGLSRAASDSRLPKLASPYGRPLWGRKASLKKSGSQAKAKRMDSEPGSPISGALSEIHQLDVTAVRPSSAPVAVAAGSAAQEPGDGSLVRPPSCPAGLLA